MINCIIAALLTAPAQVEAQAVGGHGLAGGGVDSTASVVTTTLYKNPPTAGPPPVHNGPWFDENHLEGTWSSKSMMVMTGPDFYDPVDELLIEPALPGISFSFTKDGYWEQATYQITSNPGNASCATAALTFQHGTYKITDNKKLRLTPFADDGRQLVSDPCKYGNESRYVQYDQTISLDKFEVWIDLYYGRYRLNLFEFDGTPMPPMYLVYRPPQMLPTSTMNPGVVAQLNSSKTQSSDKKKSKRDVAPSVRERIQRALINRSRTSAKRQAPDSKLYNTVWWSGVGLMTLGGIGYVALS